MSKHSWLVESCPSLSGRPRPYVSEFSYLRNIWSKCLANEAKSNDKDMTRPPTTAVNRALFLRQSATKKGAKRCETAKLVEPIQTASIERK